MSMNKTLYYKDHLGIWHAYSLHFYQSAGIKGYMLPQQSVEIETFLAYNNIYLARIDIPDRLYIPDIPPNTEMLDRLIEDSKQAFESAIERH